MDAVGDDESLRKSLPAKFDHNQTPAAARNHAAGAGHGGRGDYFFRGSYYGAPPVGVGGFPCYHPYPGGYGFGAHQAGLQRQSSYTMPPAPQGAMSENVPRGRSHQVSSRVRMQLFQPAAFNDYPLVRFSAESRSSRLPLGKWKQSRHCLHLLHELLLIPTSPQQTIWSLKVHAPPSLTLVTWIRLSIQGTG